MQRIGCIIATTVLVLLAACGGGGTGDAGPVEPEQRPAGQAVLGTAGGRVLGVDGASVEVPAGALRADAAVSIARDNTGAPPLPSRFVPVSSTFAVTPHGQTFRQPVTVRIPYDASALRADQRPAVMKGMPGQRWQLLLDAVDEGGTVAVQVRSFSFFIVVPVPRAGLFASQAPSGPDPTVSVVTTQLQNAWTTLPLTGSDARLVLQQAADDPAQVLVNVRIGSQSALAESCNGDFSVSTVTTGAVVYRLPSDGNTGGINRVATDFGTAREGRLSAYSPTDADWLTYGDISTPIARDRSYTSTEIVNAADSQWYPPPPDPWTGVQTTGLPDNATIDTWAMHHRLALYCVEGWNGWEIPIPAQQLVVARGFPIDDILITAQPPATLNRLVGQLVNQPAGWVSPVPAFSIWQQRARGSSLWAAVQPPQYVTLEFPPGIWQVESSTGGDLYGAARVADDGTSYRLRVCTSTLPVRCVYGREMQLRVSSNFPPPVITTQPLGRLYNVGQTVDMTVAYRGLPLPAQVAWQTRMADGDPWVDVGAGYRSGSPSYVHPGDESATDRLTGLQPLTTADRGRQFRATYSTVAGTATSDAATIQVTTGQAPPVFTAQPADASVTSGSAILFAAAVSGAQPMSYQWTFNGVRIPGANGTLLTLNSVNAANAGVYQLEATNVEAAVPSRAARLTVTQGANTGAPPTITGQPASLSVPAGSAASFAVSAGAGALAYQWQRNGTNIAGATQAVLALAGVSDADRGAYAVVVSNTSGAVTSSVALLDVTAGGGLAAPAITTAPVGLAVQIGQPALLAVGASGSGPLAYRWQRNGVDVAGATSPVLRIDSAQPGDTGDYTATVTNAAGSATSLAAGLVVTAAPGAPTIPQPPVARGGIEGDTATFTAAVAGNPAPSCLWLRDGIVIPGATSCVAYTTPALTPADNGAIYNLFAYSAGGYVFAQGAVLTVQPGVAPTFSLQPTDWTTTEGGQAQFSGIAGGTPSPTFAWLVDGAELPLQAGIYARAGCTFAYDALGGNFALANVSAGCSGRVVTLRVSNAFGSVTSGPAVLRVTPAVPANALTATQIVAGQEWSLVLRPDRTVWGWGSVHDVNGKVVSAVPPGQEALRPVRMYPSVLSDVRAISGWFNSFWALKGEPGSTGSRVLHWGRADSGSDGRGGDGNGSLGSSIATRYNEATPVEVLERVNNAPRPVDRVCAVAGGGEQLAMIRAVDSTGATTDCKAGSAKTVWFVGSLLSRGYESTGVAFAMPGMPIDSPPAVIFTGKTISGSPGLAIALEDGRVYGLGANPYGGFGVPSVGGGPVGGLGGPLPLPATWGKARSFGMSFYYSLFAVRADGSVMTSGYDATGELGLGSVIGGSILGPLPVLAESCTGLPCADVLTGVTAIVGTTTGATLALKNGMILGWGARDSSGLRGPGVTAHQPFPRAVPSTVTGFTALSASHAHALVIGPGNVVYAWGSGLRGALGDGMNGGMRTEPGMVTVP
jgi:alpha-tubulin suppressor-like RCC1 family protein